MPIISLTSDFGVNDAYVAQMKAAILGICPSAVLVDVTHGVDKFDVRAGAFMLASAAPYFPKGTIHLAVVDPGVGTNRRPIIIETERSFFVGPDNGLLILAAESQGIKQVREITTRRLMLKHVSRTFHGRDIFASAAAHLANGTVVEEFGPQVTDFSKPTFTQIAKGRDGYYGEVLHVDDFGNVITNIHARDLTSLIDKKVTVELHSTRVTLNFLRTYGDAQFQEPLVLIGSHNYLELAVNQGNAAQKFQVRVGDKITLTKT
jgi:S-adenosylmethionine hydrolase